MQTELKCEKILTNRNANGKVDGKCKEEFRNGKKVASAPVVDVG